MPFYQQIQRIIFPEHMSNEEILNNIGTKETFIFTIRKKKLKHNEVRRPKEFNTHRTYLR